MTNVATPASFMALMIRDYADQLEIPSAFVQGMGMGRQRVNGKFVKGMGTCKEGEYQIRVWGSGGSHCWIVQVEKNVDGLFFRKGWSEFVKENNLSFADVLMLIHEGKAKFLVKIFEPTGLKRNMASIISKEKDVVVEVSDEKDGEDDDEPMNMDPKVAKRKYYEPHMNEDLKEENGVSDDGPMNLNPDEANGEGYNGSMNMNPDEINGQDDDQPMSMIPDAEYIDVDTELMNMIFAEPPIFYLDSDGRCHLEVESIEVKGKKKKIEPTWKECFHHREGEGEMPSGEHDCGEPTLEQSFDLSNITGEIEQGSVGPPKKMTMPCFEEEKKLCSKESSALPPFSSTNTHFLANWSPTWLHYLNIPKEIVIAKDLHSKSQLLFRDVTGKTWFMNLSKQEDGTMNISEDWSKFCSSFGLKEGDRCTLEFTSSRIVHVHISATRSKLHRCQ